MREACWGLVALLGVGQAAELWEELLWKVWREKMGEERPKIGLALGGGGARGMAHIGVLRVLEEEDIPVDRIAGTSVGALVGGLYAAGVEVETIERLAADVGWGKLTDLGVSGLLNVLLREKLLSTRNMEKYLERQIGRKTFEELKIPFACIAADLITGEEILFKSGPVAPAVRASATIPGVFEPMRWRHRYLVDGGIVENVPVSAARNLGGDFVIASFVRGEFADNDPSNVMLVLAQAIHIQGEKLVRRQLGEADLVISPEVGDILTFDLGRWREAMRKGVGATRGKTPEIRLQLYRRTAEKFLQKKP